MLASSSSRQTTAGAGQTCQFAPTAPAFGARSAGCVKRTACSLMIVSAYGSMTAGSELVSVTGIAGLPRSESGTLTVSVPFGPVTYEPVTVVAVPMNASFAWSYWPKLYETLPVAETDTRVAYARVAVVPSLFFRALVQTV